MNTCQGRKTTVAFFGKLQAIETFWLILNQNIKLKLCNKHWGQHNRPNVVVMLAESFVNMDACGS